MFTGIVQGTGQIVRIQEPSADFRIHIVDLSSEIADDLQIGASVANNGCCLTITEIDGSRVSFDLMGETLPKTNLGRLKEGDIVNLERAAKFGDEIDGHLMSGHTITTTRITRIKENDFNHIVWFILPDLLKPYILTKGFVGLDGCSLTMGDVTETELNVYLILEALKHTLFDGCRVGDTVNIEIDPQIQAAVDTVKCFMKQQRQMVDIGRLGD